MAIGDEPDNTSEYADPPEEAVLQGEGGTGVPLLSALHKIHRDDILVHAYALARANAGAPGVDGMTFAAVEAMGREK